MSYIVILVSNVARMRKTEDDELQLVILVAFFALFLLIKKIMLHHLM
jgi:hypothetical protein